MSQPPRIAVLACGEGSNLQAVLDAISGGELHADVVLVAGQKSGAGALTRAAAQGIEVLALGQIDRTDRRARAALESRLLRALDRSSVDLVVLAGWMLILSPEFLAGYSRPIINLHPALLDPAPGIPVLRGAHAVRDALRLRLPYTGVTIHHVTPEVDGGPVILSERVDILPDDDEASLYRRIKPVEHRLLIRGTQSVLPTLSGGSHAGNHRR